MGSGRASKALSIRGWSSLVGANQSKIVDLLVSSLGQLLAVVGAVLLFAGQSFLALVAGVVVAAAAWVSTAWLLRREAGRKQSLLTVQSGTRLVLAVAAAGGYVRHRPDDVGWVWLATGLAVLAVLSEQTITVLLSKTEQVAVHLPGVRAVLDPPFPPSLLSPVSHGLVLVGGVLALVGAPGWFFFAIAAGCFAATVVVFAHAAQANRVSQRSAAALPAALKAYRPAFVVYYGGTHGARYQLGMWLPYLERLGQPFIVITRQAETVPTIAELTSAPILVPKLNSTVATLDQLVVKSLKAAFYVQGSTANLSFQRYRQLTHVWLNHGDSDKAANFSARHATYDKVFVSGQQGVERYAAHGVQMPPGRFAIVGRPQVERIEVCDEPLPPGAPRTVLYAPTWRGGRPNTDYSSLKLGDQIVAALLQRHSTVIFRPHPLSHTDPADARLIEKIQSRLAADRAATGRAHLWGRSAETDRDVADCLNAADALITDVSSVASDNLASGKPFAMVATRSSGDTFRRDFPMARVAYVIEKDLSTLEAVLEHLHGDDSLAPERRAYRAYCLGDWIGPHAADEFLRVAGQIVAGQPVTDRPVAGQSVTDQPQPR